MRQVQAEQMSNEELRIRLETLQVRSSTVNDDAFN